MALITSSSSQVIFCSSHCLFLLHLLFFLLDFLPFFFVGNVAVMSADSNEDVMLKSLRRGAEYYLVKPVLMEDVTNFWQYVFKRRRQKLSLETEKKGSSNVTIVEVVESFEEEDESDGDGDGDGDEYSAVSDGEKSYQESAVETRKEEEEDTLTSPMPKKPKLNIAGSSASGTADSGSGLCTNPIEDEQLIPPPQPWLPPPPQEQGTNKKSEAETEDDHEGSDMAKGGDQLFPK